MRSALAQAEPVRVDEEIVMEFRLPELGEGVYEAEMVRWLVRPGDSIKPGQPLLEALTDKATMEVPSPFAGVIQNLQVVAGDKLKIGQVILTYENKKESAPASPEAVPTAHGSSSEATHATHASLDAPAPKRANSPPPARNNGVSATPLTIKAAPSVRLMARKLGIDLSQVRGSGPAGRILIEDLSQHVAMSHPTIAPVLASARPDYGTAGSRIKMQGLRRKIAEHMVLSMRTVPHYTYVDECDVTELVRLRDSLKDSLSRKKVKITYLTFLVKAVVAALKEVPIVNSTLDDQAGEILLHDQYHIGIAVATPGGLLVPVVHDADKMSLLDVAREIERLGNDARMGKSKLEDLRGGTFTITSIGNLGGLFATPIIHHPQVGILGVGKIVKRPVFDERGQVVAADMIYLSWTFDHRVLDGAVGTAFGNAVLRQLQKPAALMVE